MSDGFQMPPSIAGDNSDVTPDGDGAKNFGMVTGGLTLVFLAGGIAWKAKNRILGLAGQDAQSQATLTVN